MSEFGEADQRLAAMHGYAGGASGHAHTQPRCLTCHPLTAEEAARLASGFTLDERIVEQMAGAQRAMNDALDAVNAGLAAVAPALLQVAATQERLEAKVDALETLVRALTHALRAGAVGKWT